MKIQGVFVPFVTPFKEDKVDFVSYKKMCDYYLSKNISGIVPLGTTGESPTISEYEYEEIIAKTVEYTNNKVPIYIGAGGNDTKKVVKQLKVLEKYKINGILSVCPYYNRPDQRGIYEHFSNIAQSTDLDIIIYNIPYRTGRKIENSTLHKLAEIKNIVAVKDSSGDIKQSMDLLMDPPKDFSILTGEDVHFYNTLLNGGDGGILASSHICTDEFLKVYELVKENNHKDALEIWKKLYKFIPLLFEEPNPAPLKYCLKKMGLIESAEVRMPLLDITPELMKKLDKELFNS